MLPGVTRAAILTRISKDRQAASQSPEQQETECRADAERRGWTVERVFTERDRSASRYAKGARPEFDLLREFIDGGGCDVLMTWEASRSTRDLAVFVPLRDLCRSRGVRLYYAGRLLDLTDPTDQFQAGLDALLAEQESARTSSRTLRAARANAAAGRPHGKQIYGYRRVYDAGSGRLVSVELEPAEAAMLRDVAGRLLAGESLNSVIRSVNACGHRTRAGALWSSYSMRRCLLNPTYAGKRVHRGEVVGDAVWPAMYDGSTVLRLQALLNDPARDTVRGQWAVAHLLSGIARCGRDGCGGVMRVLTNRGSLSYTCLACKRVARKKEPVDQLVTDILLAGQGARLRRALIGDGGQDDRSVEAQAAHEAALEKRARLDTFYDSAATGSITAAALARIEPRLLAEIAQHERIARRAVVPAQFRHLAEVDIAADWPRLPLTTQRGLIRRYLDVTILPWGKGRRVFDPASVRVEWWHVDS